MWKRTDVKVVVGLSNGKPIWAYLESNGEKFRLGKDEPQ